MFSSDRGNYLLHKTFLKSSRTGLISAQKSIGNWGPAGVGLQRGHKCLFRFGDEQEWKEMRPRACQAWPFGSDLPEFIVLRPSQGAAWLTTGIQHTPASSPPAWLPQRPPGEDCCCSEPGYAGSDVQLGLQPQQHSPSHKPFLQDLCAPSF